MGAEELHLVYCTTPAVALGRLAPPPPALPQRKQNARTLAPWDDFSILGALAHDWIRRSWDWAGGRDLAVELQLC